MHKIYTLILILIAFASGLTIGMNHSQTQFNPHKINNSKVSKLQFQELGQYDPKYMAYSDQQMLEECEKYDMVYDYENGQCKYEIFTMEED
ncbi:MAG: hypothetical protein KAH01_04845 [Caldisericia bacterium]|nr:hypothetical protein [Caldisericia bacterium]